MSRKWCHEIGRYYSFEWICVVLSEYVLLVLRCFCGVRVHLQQVWAIGLSRMLLLQGTAIARIQLKNTIKFD